MQSRIQQSLAHLQVLHQQACGGVEHASRLEDAVLASKLVTAEDARQSD